MFPGIFAAAIIAATGSCPPPSSPFTVGHLTIGVALAYLDFRFDALRWRDGHPKLAAWHATFNARPSVQANMPVDDR